LNNKEEIMRLCRTICLVILGIFVIASLSYAYAAMINLAPDTTGPEATQTVEKAVSDTQKPIDAANADTTRGKGDEGSPLHAWKAIIAGKADSKGNVIVQPKKAGDTITTQEFEQLRNWSARTRGYELQSLVAIGVLERVAPGQYRLLVDATEVQIDTIDQNIIPIVDKTRRDGTRLGLRSHRLDAGYLGGIDKQDGISGLAAGEKKLADIRGVISGVLGTDVKPPAEVVQDFAAADAANNGKIQISEVINNTPPQTQLQGYQVEGLGVTAYPGVESGEKGTDTYSLLANLADMRLLEPVADIGKAGVADFNPTKVSTILFKGDFVTRNPKGFAEAFIGLQENEIAVIVSTSDSEMELEIKAALESAELLGEWGNRIIVMNVKPGSPAAEAFQRLFGDANMLTDFTTAKKILDNKDAVTGVAGAV